MRDVVAVGYVIDAVMLALGVAGVMLVWFRGSLFASWRSYWQACKSLERTPGMSWYIDWNWWWAGLGELLSCRLCLSVWLTAGLWFVGLLPGYAAQGDSGARLAAWLVFLPAAALLAQELEEWAERGLGFKDQSQTYQ